MGKLDNGAASAPTVEAPERYVWDSPGQDVRIVVEREAAGHLREAAKKGASGGLLIGEFSDEPQRAITVRGVEPLAWSLGMDDEERGRFEDAVKAAGAKGRAVGYYRAQLSQELFLTASDLVLMKSFFPESARIFLLLKRASAGDPAGEPTTRFFFWDNGLLRPGWTETAMPFGRPLARGEEPPAAVLAEPEPVPMELAEELPRRGRPRRRFVTAAVVVLLAAAGLIAALRYTPVLRQAREWFSPPPAPSAPGRPTFALDVEKKTGDLVLTWSRTVPAIQTATRAVLYIRDGVVDRSYDVDVTQLQTGTVFYTPLSGDVQFRLEVYGAGELPAIASARVLSAALPPPLAVPAQPSGRPMAPASAAPLPAIERAKTAASAARREEESRAAAELQPRTLYYAYPRAAEPRPETVDAPPVLGAARPVTEGPAAVMPRGVRVDAPPPPAPAPAPAPAKPAALPATPPARVSDYAGPVVTRRVSPSVPANVRAMLRSESRVEVKVAIDETGKVVRAEAVNRTGEMASYLSQTAVNTARMWRFRPARNNGKPVPSEMVLNFRFTR